MMLGIFGQPLSCAASWAVARPWQPLVKPTLAQVKALSSWTMSSAMGMRVPFCSVLISAGMPTTVTTVRMPVSCAGHHDPACFAHHLFWEYTVAFPLSPGSPPLTTTVHSPLPSCLGENLLRQCGPVWGGSVWLYPIN